MKKTHTTFQTLLANTFNAHDETGDGLLWLGPVLFDGTVVTIGGYRARYNGIIVEDLSIVTHDTSGDRYVCLTGIDAGPTSTPYTLTTNLKQGICLMEKYKEGWITKGKIFNNDLRGLAFSRATDVTGTACYACYGPGICEDGTVVHTPIKVPFSIDVATGSSPLPGVSDKFFNDATTNLGTVSAYGCIDHLVIYTETTIPKIVIKNNALFTSDSIPGVQGTCLSIIETTDTHCIYAYTVLNHLFVGVNEYGVGPGVPIDYTLGNNIVKLDFVAHNTVALQLADGTFVYGMLLPATIDILFSGSSRWFHVDRKNGDLVHIGTDNKLYKNAVQIGECTNFALVFDGKIIQVTSTGLIIDGTKVTETGYAVTGIVTNRTSANELFMMFVDVPNICAVSYDPVRCETTFSSALSGAVARGAVTFGDNITTAYLGDNEYTYQQPVSVGSLQAPPDIEIVPSEDNHWRYGTKHFQLDGDRFGDIVFVGSNTNGVVSYRVGLMLLGYPGSHVITSFPAPGLIVGPRVSDGDCLKSTVMINGTEFYTKCLAIDYDGSQNASLLTSTPAGAIGLGACDSISSGISVSGGLVGTMEVYAMDSVVSNMEIQTLNIRVARNVMFVGCDIGAYTDFAVAPNVNTYKFVGCSIGGVPATSHTLLTDRSVVAQHPATAISYASPEFDYGIGVEPILTCTEVWNALDQLITRFTGHATWVAGAPPVFTNFDAVVTWANAYGGVLVSMTVDVLSVQRGAAEYAHRKMLATVLKAAGTYTLLVSDSEIVYETLMFKTARLDPATYLSGMTDYVEVFDGATFGIKCAAISGCSHVTYSVNIVINEIISVDKTPA